MLLDAIKQMPAFRRRVSSRRGHFVKWQGYNFRFPHSLPAHLYLRRQQAVKCFPKQNARR